jgi:hypothetical protein
MARPARVLAYCVLATLPAGCVSRDFAPLGRELPCALPAPTPSPEGALVIVRALGNGSRTICSGVALSPRLIATQLRCVLGRSEPATTEVAQEPLPEELPESYRTRSGSLDLTERCEVDAGWAPIEHGDFASRLGASLPSTTISVMKVWTGPDTPGVAVTQIFAMPASSSCQDPLVLLALEADVAVAPVAIRFGEPPGPGQPLVLSGFCEDFDTQTLQHRAVPTAVEGAVEEAALSGAPARAFLADQTVAAYGVGGAAYVPGSHAVVGLIMSGTPYPDCEPIDPGTTVVIELAPYRRLLLDAAAEVGATIYSELDPELGTALCP